MDLLAQAIVETAREPLLVLDEELRIKAVNRSFYEVFQVSPEEAADRPIYELGNRQWDIPELRELLERILPNGGQVQDFKVEHEFPMVGRRTALLNARRFRHPDDGTHLILIAIEDITEHAQAEEELGKRRDELEEMVAERTAELKRANDQLRHDNAVRKQMEESLERRVAELDAFTYSVSHDLKEPLRTIEALSQFVLEDYADRLDEQGRDYLIRQANAAIRMKDLIDDLLTLSRVSRQRVPPIRVDVGRLVRVVVEEMQPKIDAENATVAVEEMPSGVLGQPTLLMQVFANLIGNAIKFNESEEPHVRIGVRATEGRMVTFYVQDNGIGIDPQYHERIFGVFQRLHRREEYEGTGAGLAIVRRAMETLGGRIWVESEPGAGTTFLFTLPLWTKAAASRAARAA
jgi:PAS domain S-box-containing protein